MMMKKLCLVFISILQLCSVSAGAQTNDKAKEMAMKIADRILSPTIQYLYLVKFNFRYIICISVICIYFHLL